MVESLGGRHSGVKSDEICLRNRIDISIRPASFRTIRGITSIGAICEEISIWQSDESRNPDHEILSAIRPSLATTNGTLFCIGSPHARRGETWATYRKHFGPSGHASILVANGPTKVFNPTIKQSVIDRAYEDDPQVAASEWGGQFRSDLESYVSPETVSYSGAYSYLYAHPDNAALREQIKREHLEHALAGIHGSGGVSGTLSLQEAERLEPAKDFSATGTGDYSRAVARKNAELQLQKLADQRHAAHPEEKASTSYSKVLLDPSNAQLRRAALVA